MCIIGASYAVTVIVRLHKYRQEFAHILSTSSTGLNKSRFVRLFVTSLLFLVIFLPLQIYVFIRNLTEAEITTFSWSSVHNPGTWQDIKSIPTFGEVEFDRWVRVSLGYVVFFCFGLGNEAKATYSTWLRALGFGLVFPRLRSNRASNQHDNTRTSAVSSSLSWRSKAKLLFFNSSSCSSRTSSTLSGQLDTLKSQPRSDSSEGSIGNTFDTNLAPSDVSISGTLLPLWSKLSRKSSPVIDFNSTATSNATKWPSFPRISVGRCQSSDTRQNEQRTWSSAEDALRQASQQKGYEDKVLEVLT